MRVHWQRADACADAEGEQTARQRALTDAALHLGLSLLYDEHIVVRVSFREDGGSGGSILTLDVARESDVGTSSPSSSNYNLDGASRALM